MIALTIAAGLLVAIFGVWLLVEFNRGGKSRLLLAGAIPVLLAWPVGIQVYGNTLLGYATEQALTGEFTLVSSYTDERIPAIYALVRLKGEAAPRLYIITSNFEQNRKSFAAASALSGKGIPMAGRKAKEGDGGEGVFKFYQLPPSNLPSKG